MSLLDIVLYPKEVLATRALEIKEVNDEIRRLVDDMAQTMYDAPGVGLAAPQINVLKRLTVIDVSPVDEDAEGERERELHVLINPKIVHRQGKIIWEEGCLSIPGIYEKIERDERIVVEALNRDGNPFELEADGLLSVCIQHELDHLDGVVFLDRISALKRRMALKKYRKHLDRLEQEAREAEQDQA